MLSGPATRPKTPLAVANSVGKLAAAEMWRQMSAWEREFGELPSPIWSLLDRKVGQGLDAYRLEGWRAAGSNGMLGLEVSIRCRTANRRTYPRNPLYPWTHPRFPSAET